MSIDFYRQTEDLTTLKEFKVPPIDDTNQILLGISIIPSPFEDLFNQKKYKKQRFSFSIKSFKELKGAIISVRSLYQKCLIRNKSTFKSYWDVIIELVLSYNIITTLFFLAYQYPSGGMLVIDLACWIVFIIDIGFNFFTEQIDEKGNSIQRFRKIAYNYLIGWFIFDILTILPLSTGGYPMAEYLLRMFRLLKLPGIFNLTDGTGLSYLLTYFCIGKREENGKVSYSFTTKIFVSLVRLFIIIIFIVYFFGCFWYWFQKIVVNYKYSLAKDGTDENSFERYFELEDLESKDIAIRSSYFILTTISTIGYGDFLPRNVYEMAFVLSIMLFGVTLFGVIMGNFNSAIVFYTEATSGVDYLGKLNTFLESIERIHGAIDKELRSRILDYFVYYFEKDRLKLLAKNYWEANTVHDLVSISQDYVKKLPEEDYYHILDNLFSDVIYNYKYFFGSSKMKYALLPHFQPRRFMGNTLIFYSGRYVSEVYFLLNGSISIGYNVYNQHQTLLYCEEGRTIIGDYQAMTRVKNKFDYLAQTIVEAYFLDGDTFVKILDNFYKNEKSRVMAIAVKRENNLKRLYNDHVKQHKIETICSERGGIVKSVMNKENDESEELDQFFIESKLSELGEQTKDANEVSIRALDFMKMSDGVKDRSYKKLV
ncbi:hypothetical protein SteCoe_305 [Stentor coeruleus]|uniref:Potassium channel domain-containing protein n=1 Tax=Stentor coeruleus TaxID=5963 RepID=A0A1R2D4D6_9CILI|nr:hypothetical protein SteCoe_305 [Stentor coeruleus]